MWNILTEKFVFRLREPKPLNFSSPAFCSSSSPCLCLPQSFQISVFPNLWLPFSYPYHSFHVCLFITSTSLHFLHRREYKNHPLIFYFLFFRLFLSFQGLAAAEQCFQPETKNKAGLLQPRGRAGAGAEERTAQPGGGCPLLPWSWGSAWEEGLVFPSSVRLSWVNLKSLSLGIGVWAHHTNDHGVFFTS